MLKKMNLIKLPKEVKKYFAISTFVYTTLRLVAMTSPLLMKVMIDDALPTKDYNAITVYVILFCSIPIASVLVDVLYFRWINGVIWHKSLAINHRVFTNMIDQPLEYFSKKDAGELINLYKSDITLLYSYYMIERPKMVSQGICAVIILISLYALSPMLALVQIASIPLIIMPTRKIFKKVSSLSSEIFKSNGQRIGLVSECIRNIKSIKINLFGDFYGSNLAKHHDELVAIWKKVLMFDVLATAWGNSFVGPLNLIFSFVVTIYAVISGNMTIGSLLLVVSYAPIFCNFLVSYASTNIRLANKNEEFTNVLNLSYHKSDVVNLVKQEIQAIESISFDEVDFSYHDYDILKGVSFKVQKGDVLHIKGANGSGKSTLLDLLTGLKHPKAGMIKINDIPINQVDMRSYYGRTTYMIQDIELPALSLRAYFKLHNPNVSDDEILVALNRVNIDVCSLNSKEGLDTTIKTTVSNFSGGEKRKLILAAMLIKDADLILLDEFTANADITSVNAMKILLEEIVSQKNKIIVLISHDTDFSEISECQIELSA